MQATKTVLLTGCSSGIGEALAREFQTQGFHVIATARRPDSITHLAEAGMTTITLDVTKQESIKACEDAVRKITGGKLDVLVNNAGVLTRGALADATEEQMTYIFNTNVFGIVSTVSTFMPQLMAAKGVIVNISSASAVTPLPFKGLYAMTKAALNSYGRTLAIELEPFGVRVLTCPTGYIQTPLEANGRDYVPEGSLYKAMEGRMDVGVPPRQTPAPDFARRIVREAKKGTAWKIGPFRLGGMAEWLWVGEMVATVRWISWLGEGFIQHGVKGVVNWPEITRTLLGK